MAHRVEVRRIGGDVAETMAEMRAWIDTFEAAVIEFEYSRGGPGTTFRVSFQERDAAKAFANAFKGRLAGRDPNGAALWKSTRAPNGPQCAPKSAAMGSEAASRVATSKTGASS